MVALKRSTMTLGDRFDAEASLLGFERIIAPTWSWMIDWRATRFACLPKAVHRPGDSTLKRYGAVVRENADGDFGDIATHWAPRESPFRPAPDEGNVASRASAVLAKALLAKNSSTAFFE
jgi:hypothetical protein